MPYSYTLEIIKMLSNKKTSINAICKYLIKEKKVKNVGINTLRKHITEIKESLLEQILKKEQIGNDSNRQLIKNEEQNLQKKENTVSVSISGKSVDERIQHIFNEFDKIEDNDSISSLTKMEILEKQQIETYGLCRIINLKLREQYDPDLVDNYTKLIAVNIKNMELLSKLTGDLADERIVVNIISPMVDDMIMAFTKVIKKFHINDFDLVKEALVVEFDKLPVPEIIKRVDPKKLM